MKYSEDAQHLREQIKKYREAKGWSKFQLADNANIDRSGLSQFENGRRDNIMFHNICKIADALGVNPSDLVR